MNEDLRQSSPFRLIRGLVPQMPFPKEPRPIPRRSQYLSDRRCRESKPFAFENRMSDSILELMPTRYQGTSSRRASRTDMKIGETQTLTTKLVEVRCLKNLSLIHI